MFDKVADSIKHTQETDFWPINCVEWRKISLKQVQIDQNSFDDDITPLLTVNFDLLSKNMPTFGEQATESELAAKFIKSSYEWVIRLTK